MRSPQTLSEAERRLVAAWAADCAERVLGLFGVAVLVFTVGEGQGAPSANPEIKVFKPKIVSEEPLHAEIRSFLHAVRTRERPVVTLQEGRRALAVALEVLAQIETHSRNVQLR